MLEKPRATETAAALPAWAALGGVVLAVIATQALVLRLMGRPLSCACGAVRLWSGDILSSETSQQLSDWYSFTHVEHGLLFYFLGWLLLPRLSVSRRFLIALVVEAAWEIMENSAWFVEIYRRQALAIGYSGDSVINSISDVAFMSIGYFFAAVAPVWASVGLLAAIEIVLAGSIRDSLALNLLNFVHPVEAVTRWQSGKP
jgi:Protein of unknown function (DUF2585)